MNTARAARLTLVMILSAALSACGGAASSDRDVRPDERRTTIWDLFRNNENPNNTVGVNKYLWNASLDVLNFLPVQSIDPFTGVIVTGYGTPPGGGRS